MRAVRDTGLSPFGEGGENKTGLRQSFEVSRRGCLRNTYSLSQDRVEMTELCTDTLSDLRDALHISHGTIPLIASFTMVKKV